MSNTEHVIALVAKLEDQAPRGFNAMAGAAERAASRVEATQVKAAAAVAKTISRSRSSAPTRSSRRPRSWVWEKQRPRR